MITSHGIRAAIYCRVSGSSQTTTQQVAACRQYYENRGWEVSIVVEETKSTRKTRPQKEKLLKDLRQRKYDVLVLFRMDRWARNLSELILEIEDLSSLGVHVASLSETVDTSSAMGRAMLQLIGVFAQLERDMRAEATRERLAALKAIGKKLGHQSPIRGEKFVLLQSLKKQGASNREAARQLGVSETSIRRALRDGVRRCPSPSNSIITPTKANSTTLTASPTQEKMSKETKEGEHDDQ